MIDDDLSSLLQLPSRLLLVRHQNEVENAQFFFERNTFQAMFNDCEYLTTEVNDYNIRIRNCGSCLLLISGECDKSGEAPVLEALILAYKNISKNGDLFFVTDHSNDRLLSNFAFQVLNCSMTHITKKYLIIFMVALYTITSPNLLFLYPEIQKIR